ncbi:LysR family transcriptional regulator [Salinicola sp. LHM]|uniref:LysR family transcriptional regulator n=1 Tax=unclassified Salinicola TaxID=2634022 RepID=UPI0008DDF6AC|nr:MULTISPECIES: LysR family transcriptional regulator [unclassified Salinicola]MED5499435.1 LysR family transcriptional regulator [Pseudomonadota bacterium]OHZ02959.1 LysR family transcriptional regulator [Salinicola sp. MIT1003]WQH32895.1 LysR family transcriptional regulator [Salinicola sp. LHM]
MEVAWYEDFLALADTGKFTAAAKLRNSSQSALSRRIRLLEKQLGAALVDRQATPVRLTAAGDALLPTAMELVRLAQECEQSVKVIDRPLTFASLHTLACNFFPQWISRYTCIHGPLYTRIDTGHKTTENYYMALMSGRCDFILFYRDEESERYFQREDFEAISLGHDELYWVGTPQLASDCLRSDLPIPWLTYSRSAQLHALARDQVSRHPQPHRLKRVFEATVSEALKPMVAMGHGIACMPHSMVEPLIDDGSLVRLYPDMPSEHLEIILVRWLGNRNRPADAFWQSLDAASESAGIAN